MSSSLPKFRGSAPKDLRKSYQATKNRHMPQKGWSFQQQVGGVGFPNTPKNLPGIWPMVVSIALISWKKNMTLQYQSQTSTLSLKIPSSQTKLKQQKREISSIDTSFPCDIFSQIFFGVKSHVIPPALWPMSPGSAKQEWDEALGWAKIVPWITTCFYWFLPERRWITEGWILIRVRIHHPFPSQNNFAPNFDVSQTCHTSQGITLLCYIGFLHMIWSWYFLLRVWLWCLKIVSNWTCLRRHVFERLLSTSLPHRICLVPCCSGRHSLGLSSNLGTPKQKALPASKQHNAAFQVERFRYVDPCGRARKADLCGLWKMTCGLGLELQPISSPRDVQHILSYL